MALSRSQQRYLTRPRKGKMDKTELGMPFAADTSDTETLLVACLTFSHAGYHPVRGNHAEAVACCSVIVATPFRAFISD